MMPSKLDIRKVKAELDAFLDESSGGNIKSLGEPVRLTGGFDTDIFRAATVGRPRERRDRFGRYRRGSRLTDHKTRYSSLATELKDQLISVSPDFADFTLAADQVRLGQILENLISNASKFSPSNSTISIESYIDDGIAHLEISDEGPGISRQDQMLMSSPFYRGAQRGDDTTLGSAYCALS